MVIGSNFISFNLRISHGASAHVLQPLDLLTLLPHDGQQLVKVTCGNERRFAAVERGFAVLGHNQPACVRVKKLCPYRLLTRAKGSHRPTREINRIRLNLFPVGRSAAEKVLLLYHGLGLLVCRVHRLHLLPVVLHRGAGTDTLGSLPRSALLLPIFSTIDTPRTGQTRDGWWTTKGQQKKPQPYRLELAKRL